MVGPFASTVAWHMEYWFHKVCLERNEYVQKHDDVYQGIGKMIQKLIIDGKQSCGWCGQNGAAIKCKSCKTWYHGNICSEIFLTSNFK